MARLSREGFYGQVAHSRAPKRLELRPCKPGDDIEYIGVAEEDRDPTQPGNLPIHTTQESDARVSLTTMTREFRAKFTGRGSCTEEGVTRNRLAKRPYIGKSLADPVNSVVKEQI